METDTWANATQEHETENEQHVMGTTTRCAQEHDTAVEMNPWYAHETRSSAALEHLRPLAHVQYSDALSHVHASLSHVVSCVVVHTLAPALAHVVAVVAHVVLPCSNIHARMNVHRGNRGDT